MPQSLSYLLTHIVFSTKDRAPVLDAAVEKGSAHGHMRFGLKARNMVAQGGASPRAKPWVSRPDHDFQALKGRNI